MENNQSTRQISSDSMLVPVYIFSEDAKSVRAQLTRSMFDNPMFSPHIATIEAPKDLVIDGISQPKAEEIYRVRKVLDYSKERDEKDIIIIKDTSVTQSSPESIAELVRAIIDPNPVERADLYQG